MVVGLHALAVVAFAMFEVVKDHGTRAWNIDGSAGARLNNRQSWINHWEQTTGDRAAYCSYSDCSRPAQVGGHVWVARKGVFIVPLCTKCNFWENANRMQGSQSTLRYGTKLVKSGYTEQMQNSGRRIAVKVEVARHCKTCGDDISDRPDKHTECLPCFRSGRSRRTQYTITQKAVCGHMPGRRSIVRSCKTCGRDIMERPISHTQCVNCYFGKQRAAEYGDRARSRKRSLATFDVSAAPRFRPWHRNPGRSCQSCGVSLKGRPSGHTLCLDCFRRYT
jgi:hypothetical protein